MKIIDVHVHLADPALQEQDPLVRAAAKAYERLRGRLPASLRAALELSGGLALPAHRRLRDRAIALASGAFARSRNRAVYLGPRLGGRIAEGAGPLIAASFLRGTPENLLADMDAAGVSQAVVLPVAPHTTTELALSLCQTPRLVPFCSLAPGTPEIGERLARWQRAGCRGVKIHPTLQDMAADTPFFHELAEAAGALSLPILAHTGVLCYEGHPHGEWCRVRAYEPLLRAHRSTRFILAHMNLFEPDEAIEVARAHENAFLDTSWQPEGVIRRAAREVGDRRILFGSDWPFLGAELATAVDIVRRALAGRTEALENVFFRNAEELLGLRASG
jgi:predicted TIM-barrel fold metal-dependent hydrolase